MTRRLKAISSDIARIEQEIKARILQVPGLARRRDLLMSIPGIAATTAQTLLIDMPELGSLDAKQTASLVGLAPFTRQSGTWKGTAVIRGGRAQVRHALFMPALVACRFNPDLKAKYQALRDAGKPPKVALVAVMRKLVILANALLKADHPWTLKPSCT